MARSDDKIAAYGAVLIFIVVISIIILPLGLAYIFYKKVGNRTIQLITLIISLIPTYIIFSINCKGNSSERIVSAYIIYVIVYIIIAIICNKIYNTYANNIMKEQLRDIRVPEQFIYRAVRLPQSKQEELKYTNWIWLHECKDGSPDLRYKHNTEWATCFELILSENMQFTSKIVLRNEEEAVNCCKQIQHRNLGELWNNYKNSGEFIINKY